MSELPKNIIPGDSSDPDALIDQNIADIAGGIFGRGKKPDIDKPRDVSGAIEAPAGGVALAATATLEKRPRVRKPKVDNPAMGGDAATQSASAKPRRVKKSIAVAPSASVATPLAQLADSQSGSLDTRTPGEPVNGDTDGNLFKQITKELDELQRVRDSLLSAVRTNKMTESERTAFAAEVMRIHDEAKDQISGKKVSGQHVDMLKAAKERLLAEKGKLLLSAAKKPFLQRKEEAQKALEQLNVIVDKKKQWAMEQFTSPTNNGKVTQKNYDFFVQHLDQLLNDAKSAVADKRFGRVQHNYDDARQFQLEIKIPKKPAGRRPRPGKGEGVELSEAESQQRREKWLQEKKVFIEKNNDLAVLLAQTEGVGTKRKIKFPDFKLFRKDTAPAVKKAFGGALYTLLELWRVQVVKILFDRPDAIDGFVKFLEVSFQALHSGKIDKGKFFSQYLKKTPALLTGIEDLKDTDVLNAKLDELWGKYYPGAETQYKATRKGGKAKDTAEPQVEALSDEEQFAALRKALEAKSFEARSMPFVFGNDKEGKKLIIEKIDDDGIKYRYGGESGVVRPTGVKENLKFLEEQFSWSLEKKKAPSLEGSPRAKKEVTESEARADLEELKKVVKEQKDLAEARFKDKANNYTPGQLKQLEKFLNDLLTGATNAVDHPVNDKSFRRPGYALKEAREADFEDEKPVQKKPAVKLQQSVPDDPDDAARKGTQSDASAPDHDEAKELARIKARKEAKKAASKGGKPQSSASDLATPEPPKPQERTYEELKESLDLSEVDELVGIAGTTFRLALEYSRSSGKSKQAVIDEKGTDYFATKILVPAIKLALPSESDWNDAEREAFSQSLARERIELFVKEKPKK